MTMSNNVAADKQKFGISMARNIFLPLGILLVAFLILFWVGFSYSGIVARMAEWQFSYFGKWFPMITILSFCALGLLFWRFVGWLRKRSLMAKKKWTDADERDYIFKLARTAYVMLRALAVFCFVIVVVAFFYWLILPNLDTDTKLTKLPNYLEVQEGSTNLAGSQPIGPIARYREAIFGIGPEQHFAPIASRKLADGSASEFTVFAELKQTKNGPRIVSESPGLMRRNALPGELKAMYRFKGYAVSDTPAVVFLSPASAGRATLILMIEAFAAGVIFLVFALVMRRRSRKIAQET
jgi:hypothetical protein